MSAQTGFDFASRVDVTGGNFWIWHKKMTTDNSGLKLIKAATSILTEADLPNNWRDTITKRSSNIRVVLPGQSEKVELDESHQQVIDWLAESGFTTFWNAEHHCLQTKTCALAKLAADPAKGIKGRFTTNSQGRNPAEPNCFMYPLPGGAWAVYRFGKGTQEHESWSQDGKGWTHTTFNCPLRLVAAAEIVGAVETAKGGFAMPPDAAAEVAKMTGLEFTPPDVDRDITLQPIRMAKDWLPRWTPEKAMPNWMAGLNKLDGWVKEGKKWFRIVGKREDDEQRDIVRKITSDTGDLGYSVWTRHGWTDLPKSDIASYLAFQGITNVNHYIGGLIQQCWRITNDPFEAEYNRPGCWNRFAAQFAYPMADHDGSHPHYDMVLEHVGQNLTPAVQLSEWCRKRGITSGREYLLTWCASLVQRPFQLLPMLFYSDLNLVENQRSLTCSCHCSRAAHGKIDKVFQRGSTFDGELAGLIFGVIEEANLTGKHAQTAYNKIKDITTAKKISIERKHWDAYEQKKLFAYRAGG